MDVYHILLGRPWQYDVSSVHKGKSNTYSFCKNGVKITLAPMKEESCSKTLAVKEHNLQILRIL